MNRLLPTALAVFALLVLCASAEAAKLAYDACYEKYPAFRKLDGELNDLYREILPGLSWQGRQTFIEEQRKWHRDLFPILLEYSQPRLSPEAAAQAALQKRVDSLAKFLKGSSQEGILGLPIKFGMSEQEVGQKLGVDLTGEEPCAIELFGEKVPLSFGFMQTRFRCAEWSAPDSFERFLTSALGVAKGDRPEALKAAGFLHTSLYSVKTGDMDNAKACDALLDDLRKKYKITYPVYLPMRALVNELDSTVDFDDPEDVALKDQFFEDQSRYIFVEQSWGTVTGQFSVTWLSRPYLTEHIANSQVLSFLILETARFKENLGILPMGAPVNEVVTALGNRTLDFFDSIPGYYQLSCDVEDEEGQGRITTEAWLDKNNNAFAVQYSFTGDDVAQDFEEDLVGRLNKRYKVLKDTPDAIARFVGHTGSGDRDWETEENFLHLGTTPHFASQNELLVVNKKKLQTYIEEMQRFEKDRATVQEREINQDLGKF